VGALRDGLLLLFVALGQERFDGLVKGAMPALDLLITDECHGIPDQVFLLCRDAPTLAEVDKGLGCGLRRVSDKSADSHGLLTRQSASDNYVVQI
jgi:hypothetical protein